jgi:NDP-sugar pyrophosphorylase family protein
VQLDDAGAVRRVGGAPAAWVTGGVYAFAPSARARAREVLDAGRERMRAFLAALVDGCADVRAVCVARVIDVDRAHDLVAANEYLDTRDVIPRPSLRSG